MITIKPNGGLANRLRVISSALLLARKSDKKLQVIWDADEDLNSPYYSLFKPNDFFSVKEDSSTYIGRRVKKYFTNTCNAMGIKYPRGYEVTLQEADILRLIQEKFDFLNLKNYSTIYINTCNVFFGNYKNNPLHDFFLPVDSIDLKATQIYKQFKENTIGIHIRRTDHVAAKNNSPLSAFCDIINKEIKKNLNTRFYLCTDEKDVENHLIKSFGSRIITREKDLSRNTQRGIEDALIDLICLSKTQLIIGSYYSSFSEIAAYLGGVDLIIAKKTN